MGLQSQLNDVASDSIPFLLLSLIATAVTHLRSLLSSLRRHHHRVDPTRPTVNTVSEHRKLNSSASFRYLTDNNVDSPCCVFCLSVLRCGDRVRRLDCRHVFHKDCLDGWIDQMRFHCPLCRSPLLSHSHVDRTLTRRRVGGGRLDAWFSVQ